MLARLFALLLTVTQVGAIDLNRPTPADLPNDCGIIAAEALSRLKSTGQWTRVIGFDAVLFLAPGKLVAVHHILIAYQLDPKSNVLLYDQRGTAELQTTSHDIKNIVAAFEKFDVDLCIVEAHFLSP